MKILGVGNSFTVNSCKYLKEICECDKDAELDVTIAYIGGCPFDKHVTLAEIHEEDPSASAGIPYPQDEPDVKKRKSLKQLLQQESWDIVTIQQFSFYSPYISTYRPHAENLCKYIRKYEPDAEIVMHETWAYRSDSGMFVDGYTQQDMYDKLSFAYREISKELGNMRVIPVGDAFQVVRGREDYKYVADESFDKDKAVYPELPDQTHSLCVGYKWDERDNGHVIGFDPNHAGVAGEYLGGLVWYEFFTGKSAENITYIPDGVSAEGAKVLREVAHQVVMNEPTLKI